MTDSYRLIQDGQPVGTRQKAHTMILEVLAEWGLEPRSVTPKQLGVATTEALCRAIEQQEDLRHDLERQMSIANEHVNEVDTLLREIETLRVEALAERGHGYYIGFAKADEQSDALREALWAMPEPYEYLNKDQLKSIRPYVDALRNWKHRYRAVLQEQSE